MRKFSLRHSNWGILTFVFILIMSAIISINSFEFIKGSDYKNLEEYREDEIIKASGLDFILDLKRKDWTLMNDIMGYYIKINDSKEKNEINGEELTNIYYVENENYDERYGEGRDYKLDVEKYKTTIKVPYMTLNNQNGNIVFKTFNDGKLTKNEAFAFNMIKENIKKNFFNLYSKDANVDILYVLYPNINSLDNYYPGSLIKITTNTAFIIPIFILIVLVFLSFTNYRKINDVSIYKFIKSIPIELYIVIFAIGLIIFNVVYKYMLAYPPKELFDFIKNYILVILTLGFIVMYFYLSYIMLSLKSIYYENLKSFVFRNSIIVRIIKSIVTMMKKLLEWYISLAFIDNAKANYIISALSILFVILSIYIFNVYTYFGFITVLVLFSQLAILLYLKYDLKKSSDALEKIVKGDLSVKLDEKNTMFKKIVRNINSISGAVNNAFEKELLSERTKTELITNVSHDLKTPLTSIINYSDLINRPETSEKDIYKYAQIINEKSLRLKVLIENLFEMSKVSSKNIDVNKEKLNLNQMLNQIIVDWLDELESDNKEVILKSESAETIVELDGELTSRIFDNIFSNLNKYAAKNSRIYIDINKIMDKTRITIKNISKYPLNISPAELKERFTRGDESRNTEGAGLGLAIASSLAEIQGGKFDIEIDGDLFKVIMEF